MPSVFKDTFEAAGEKAKFLVVLENADKKLASMKEQLDLCLEGLAEIKEYDTAYAEEYKAMAANTLRQIEELQRSGAATAPIDGKKGGE